MPLKGRMKGRLAGCSTIRQRARISIVHFRSPPLACDRQQLNPIDFGALITNPLVDSVQICQLSRKLKKIQNGGQNERENNNDIYWRKNMRLIRLFICFQGHWTHFREKKCPSSCPWPKNSKWPPDSAGKRQNIFSCVRYGCNMSFHMFPRSLSTNKSLL